MKTSFYLSLMVFIASTVMAADVGCVCCQPVSGQVPVIVSTVMDTAKPGQGLVYEGEMVNGVLVRNKNSGKSVSALEKMAAKASVASAASATGTLEIILEPGAALAAHPEALAAFERAAQAWEARIRTPITVRIIANIAPLQGNTLGGASGPLYSQPYDIVRNAMVARATPPIVARLPTRAQFSVQLPPDLIVEGQSAPYFLENKIYMKRANADALGFTTDSNKDSITFNSNSAFDYDNRDGVNPLQTDFETVAIHEIGHVLGFVSYVDSLPVSNAAAPTTFDLYRFQDGVAGRDPTTAAEFTNFSRRLVQGGSHIFDDTTNEYAVENAVSQQASHWLNRPNDQSIGIMDPELQRGSAVPIKEPDWRALALMGWNVAPDAPEIALAQPAGTAIPNGGAKAFGSCVVGRSTILTFTVKSVGAQGLNLGSITTVGGDQGTFTVDTSGTVFSLSPMIDTTTFSVTFQPTAAVAHQTTLRISSNDPGNGTFEITLTGTGLAGSSDATLSGLHISAGAFVTPPLEPGVIRALVPASVSAVSFTPTASHPNARIVYVENDGVTPAVDIPSGTTTPMTQLAPGVNHQRHIWVYAEDGVAWKVYSIEVTRSATPTVDLGQISQVLTTSAILAGNVLNSGGAPITDRGFVYSTNPGMDLVIGAPGVSQISSGSGTGTFSGVAVPLLPGTQYAYRAYATNSVGTSYSGTAFVTTVQNNADLAGLAISAGTLSPAFSSGVTSYYCNVPLSTTDVYLTPTKAASAATIRVNGAVVASGTQSGPIPVPTTIPIQVVVTAQDNTTKTYQVYVSRPAFSWTYNAETDVPHSSNGYIAAGGLSLSLNFAPAPGTILTVVRNTSAAFISGAFAGYPHGQAVDLWYNGIKYPFVLNYFGGTGNDIVLQWAKARPVSWGHNTDGQLGNNTVSQLQEVPGPVVQSGVLSGKTILSVATGGAHSLALCSDGTLAAWGGNNNGQLGNNSTTDSTVPVAVVSSGVLAGKTVVAISAGQWHSLALCSDGTVAAWGANYSGQLGTGIAWPLDVTVPTAVTSPGRTVVAISAGPTHSVALCSDETILAWGDGNGGYGTPSTVPVASYSGGVAVSAGSSNAPNLRLRADGTVGWWNSSSSGTVDFSGQSAVSVAVGGFHSLALMSYYNGNYVVSWGSNDYGQLGDGSYTNRTSPGQVSGVLSGKAVRSIACGYRHSLALCTDGTLTAWGSNQWGELGIVAGNGSTPVVVDTSALTAGERFMSMGTGSTSLHNVALVASPQLMPTAATLSAGLTTPTGATLRGRVNAQGNDAVVTFEYGTTTSYGTTVSATPASIMSGSINSFDDTSVTAAITGLQPETTYHFRVVASGVAGADMTFTTRSAANPTPPGSVDGAFNSVVGGVWSAVPMSDGRILVGGAWSGAGGARNVGITRLNADGSEDASFTASTDFWGANGVALQPDGKILICGHFEKVNGVSRRYLARLDAAGNLESGTTFNPPAALDNEVWGLLVLPNGKIMVYGAFTSRIMRLNADGTQDSSFTTLPNGYVSSMALQPDGKLIVCGEFNQWGGVARGGIARLNPDGSLESTATFNSGTGLNSGWIYCVTVQADGKILIGGTFTSFNGQPRSNIARLHADGSVESLTTFKMGDGANETIHALTLQADGRILIAGGFSSWNGTAVKRYARLKPDGTLESPAEFERATDDLGMIYTIALKNDGKILVSNRQLFNDPTSPNNLTVPDTGTVLWTRGGSLPEFCRVGFELSTDDGGTWTPLGVGSRVGTTSAWQLTGLSLPTLGYIRARGHVTAAGRYASGGFLDTTTGYQASPPVSLPVVSTPTSSNIGTTAAVLGGTAVAEGSAPITERGVVYAATAANNDPEIGGTGVVKIVAPASGIFTVQATSLASGTGYNFKAYATNAQGTSYTQVSTFTTLSGNADLGGLALSAGTLSPSFASGTVFYIASVSNLTDMLTVTPTATQANATIRVNNVIVASGLPSLPLPLDVGENEISIHVTAQDGLTSKAYSVTVIRLAPPTLGTPLASGVSANGATLECELISNGGAPATQRGMVYAITNINGTPRIGGPGVTELPDGGPDAPQISALLSGLTPGTGYSFAAYATNSEGTSYSTTGTFTTPSNNADLNLLALINLSGPGGTNGPTFGVLAPAFSSSTISYTATVPSTINSSSFNVGIAQDNQTVTVNGVPVTGLSTFSAAVSAPVSLVTGPNVITTVVTAQDGTTKTYTITVTRTEPPTVTSPTVTDITTTGATLGGNITSIGFATLMDSGIVLAPTATNDNPQVNGTGVIKIPGGLAGGVFITTASSLTPGIQYSFAAFADNGDPGGVAYSPVSTFTTISNDAALSSLVLSMGALSPSFASGTTVYTASVSNVTDAITITPESQANATIRVNNVIVPSGSPTLPIPLVVGGNPIFITITAQDGFTSQTYHVNVRRLAQPTLGMLTIMGISGFGAQLQCQVTSDGGAPVTQRGMVYAITSTNATPRLGGTGVVQSPDDGFDASQISALLLGLTPDSSYSYAAYATNSEGTSYSSTGTFTTPSDNADLSGLVLSAGALSPSFASGTTAYTASVSNVTDTITVMAAAAQADATIRVNNVIVPTGSPSLPIPLVVGANVTNINVTAEDGSTLKAYTVTVTRLAPPTLGEPVASDFLGLGLGPVVRCAVNSDGGAPVTQRGVVYAITNINGTPRIDGTGVTNTVMTGGDVTQIEYVFFGLTPGTSYSFVAYATNSEGTSYSSTTTFTILAAEIVVRGNAVNIADGDASPGLGDHTDFGSTATAGGTVMRTFAIQNTGDATLTLGPVVIGGADASSFIVTAQPTSSVLAGQSATFQVTFDPAAVGLHSATLSFTTNDVDENPFNFSIQGAGYDTAAEAAAATWAESYGLSAADAAPTAEPFDDGVPNLLKYAFNMPLTGPNVSGLAPGTGSSGLPAITAPNTGGPPESIRVEFIRRRNSGLIYTPQYSINGLSNFIPMTATPAVTIIDTDWERVVVNQPLGLPLPTTTFSRVSVTAQ